MIWFLVACDGAPSDSAEVDVFCDEAPVVTWDNFGHAILTEHCQSCHASTALDRFGAPESIAFDTLAQALALKDRILAVTDPEGRSMPPAVALEEIDYIRLQIWLTCWAE